MNVAECGPSASVEVVGCSDDGGSVVGRCVECASLIRLLKFCSKRIHILS